MDTLSELVFFFKLLNNDDIKCKKCYSFQEQVEKIKIYLIIEISNLVQLLVPKNGLCR